MTYDELRNHIDDGKYDIVRLSVKPKLPKDHVFDDQKSVAWNHEQVEAYNAQRADTIKANRNQQALATQLFMEDVIRFVKDEFGLTQNRAQRVVDKAWEDGHSAGYYEVLTYANEFGQFARDILNDEA